jgi:hypothetical protein
MKAASGKIATAFLSGVLVWAAAMGLGAGSARAHGIGAGGFQAAGASQVSMAMTEGSGNIVVLQEPSRMPGPSDGFISVDTVIIGCTAGAAAGALAIALPVLTVASSGIGLPASASAILSTAGIGCAVGVVSGLAAIGTAWGLNLINQASESTGN